MSTEAVVQSTPARKVVIAGVMGALAIFLGWTHLGFIPWVAGAALTIMHVPVILGAVLEGPIVGTAIGLIFGLFSLLQAVLAPTGPVDVWFQNPVISVLPRLFIGVMAWLTYRAARRISPPWILFMTGVNLGIIAALTFSLGQSNLTAALFLAGTGLGAVAALIYQALRVEKETFALVLAALVGTLTNTILVLGAIGLFKHLPWAALPPIAIANGLPEAALAAILTVAVVVAWKRIETGARRSKM